MKTDAAVRSAESRLDYPGWRVAVVCHIGVLTGFATVFIYSFSFMVKPLGQAFGWDREQIARAFSLAAISVAICSPLIGKLFGLGMASLAFLTPHLWQLYATAVLIGVAGTGTYQLGYARVIAAWFDKRLGAALSIVVAGSGVGSFIVPPLVAHWLVTYGWRETYLGLAVLPLFIGMPLTLLFARTPRQGSAHESRKAMRGEAAEGSTWRQALASGSFWMLALGVVALSLSENGALAHLAPMLSDHGLHPEQVAFTASLLGIASVTGRFVLGWLLDYVKGSHIAAASLLAAGAGMLMLAHAQSFAAAAPAAFLAGLGGGCELDLIPYMLRRYFGLRSFSTLYGLVYSTYAVAGATAPLVVGHVYDKTGSYIGIFNVFCAVTLVASVAMLALPRYRYGAEGAMSGVIDEEPLAAAS
jgi:MFS family permease